MISSIKSDQNNDWLRQKLLERQAQQALVAQNQQGIPTSAQNITTQPQDQTNGANQVQSSSAATNTNPPPNAQLPWGNLMGQLGLSPQGSKEADLSAIGEKIAQMKAQATDPAQKTQIDNLQKQYEGCKAVAANMPAPPQQSVQSSTPPEQMTGATQLADLNKQFLVKKWQPDVSYS